MGGGYNMVIKVSTGKAFCIKYYKIYKIVKLDTDLKYIYNGGRHD